MVVLDVGGEADASGLGVDSENEIAGTLAAASVTQRSELSALMSVETVEVAVEMMNGRPLQVVRSVFNILTFKSDGTLVPPLQDPHVRAGVELALALGVPARHSGTAEDFEPGGRRFESVRARNSEIAPSNRPATIKCLSVPRNIRCN